MAELLLPAAGIAESLPMQAGLDAAQAVALDRYESIRALQQGAQPKPSRIKMPAAKIRPGCPERRTASGSAP